LDQARSVSRHDRSFALAPIKAVVDAEFDSIDGLLDVDPWHHFWDTRKRPSECYAARAKVIEIVLKLC
jgi:hypothetical protein